MGYEVPGDLAIWLALIFNVIAGVAFFLVARGKLDFELLGKRAYGLFTLFTTVAVAWLYVLFFTDNYAFKYVYEYNESTQPFMYVLSGFWGGQEGTYLLWLFMSALCGYLILKKGGQFRNWGMVIYSLINMFFLAILIALSPFALLPHAAADGLGLNPLLRDPWMVIHPPVIFLGYAIAAVPFAIAMAALIRNKYDDWVKTIFPWAAIAALMLGAGNILGGYWAYKTLGWGGFWAWDPVENSSFVPWVISIALLHGLIIERRTGALRRTNLLMAAFLFLLVVYGTFLTRSGVLADFSVHSFTDLGINIWLIGFMSLFVVLTLAIFLPRAAKIKSESISYNIFGREFALFSGMAIMFIFGVIVLFWSSLPMTSGLFGEPRAADIPTYNGFALPLSILLALLLAVSPFTNFSDFRLAHAARKSLFTFGTSALIGFGLFYFVLNAAIIVAVIFTIVLGLGGMYLFKSDLRKMLIPALTGFVGIVVTAIVLGVENYMFLLFFGVAAMAMISNFISLFGFLPHRWRMMGGELTHFGFGLMLIGILASSSFDSSEKLVIPLGESRTAELFGLNVEYRGMVNDITHPNNELILNLESDGNVEEVRPQLYYSERMDGIMRKPYIVRSPLYDLYMAPEQVKSTNDLNRIPLSKGVPAQAGGLILTFTGFEMGQHDQESGSMSVIAIVDVASGDESTTVMPAMVHSTTATGERMVKDEPASAELGGREFKFVLDQVLADRGMVVLKIPGLISEGPTEQLVIDISKKPLISLVWAGTTLILIGALIVFIRRRAELASAG